MSQPTAIAVNTHIEVKQALDSLLRTVPIDAPTYYDRSHVAILPMGYCYPGRGASGDLPPRRECAPLWLDQFLAHLPLPHPSPRNIALLKANPLVRR